ncbi:hypothetical protein LOTGIDRAFT_169035 [Lottia gigantea]|uniref:Probable RNA-binding protein 18 n=1 Tax=Lottia gigantea TaxID=225164 RepID=V4B5L2_LOTGI|nr:hypothetical protein LOTGIDRAFT_169035 [Lottia gigantea]ESO83799.1 hypothetical protein LOTGIDRAFT_169035 [Lottia gigantea]
MEVDEIIPVPDDPYPEPDDCRLWIGNIDLKITEYTILKLLQKYGGLKRFDFIYHKSGPDKGKSRGYCFCSYSNKEEAAMAMKKIHGKFAMSKKLIVKWAHADPVNEVRKSQNSKSKDVVETSDTSINSKIKEIEAKLLVMEKTKKDFSTSPNLEAIPGSSPLSAINMTKSKTSQNSQPYTKSHKYSSSKS